MAVLVLNTHYRLLKEKKEEEINSGRAGLVSEVWNKIERKRRGEVSKSTDLVLVVFEPVLAATREEEEKMAQINNQPHSSPSSIFSPAGNIFGVVATLDVVVEDLASSAAQLTWLDARQAHIELLAIIWVWEVWMSNNLAVGVVLLLVLWTLEAVL
jgi:hypothetical protein